MKRFLIILFLAGTFCLPKFTSAGDKLVRHTKSPIF